MSPTKQFRSRTQVRRIPRSYRVQLDHLEDRLAPGSILALPGSPLAELSYGGLGQDAIPLWFPERVSGTAFTPMAQAPLPRLSQLLAASEAPLAIDTHTSLLTETATGGENESAPAISAALEERLFSTWDVNPLASLTAFPATARATTVGQFHELLTPEPNARGSGASDASQGDLRGSLSGESQGGASMLVHSSPPSDQVALEALATLVFPGRFGGPTLMTPFVPAVAPTPGGEQPGTRGSGGQPPVAQQAPPTKPASDLDVRGAPTADLVAEPADDCECIAVGQPIQPPIGDPRDKQPKGTPRGKGIRLFDGMARVPSPELTSNGFGQPWGHSRVWTNEAAFAPVNRAGKGMALGWLPYMRQRVGNDEVFVVSCGTKTHEFSDLPPTGPGVRAIRTYTPRFFARESLILNDVTHEFTMTDGVGNRIVFYDFNSPNQPKDGLLKQMYDPYGNQISVSYFDSGTDQDRLQKVSRSGTYGGNTVVEEFVYTYTTVGSERLMSTVTLQRTVNSVGPTTVRKVEYSYYGTGSSSGVEGNLKTSVIKDASNNPLDTWYYRYYTTDTSTTYAGGLKYVFGPQSYARLAAAVSDPLTASDASVEPYADTYFVEYMGSSDTRVKKMKVQGEGCSACTGGVGTFTYTYATNTQTGYSDHFNKWKYKTEERQLGSDGTTVLYVHTVFTNYLGMVMLDATQASGGTDKWIDFYRYEDTGTTPTGRPELHAFPSAVSGYDETKHDLLDATTGYLYLRDTDGLIEKFVYYDNTTATETPAPTAGNAKGYLHQTYVRHGESDTSGILQSQVNYWVHAASSGNGGGSVFVPADVKVFNASGGGGEQKTSYGFPTWVSNGSGTTHRIQSQTFTPPVAVTAHNGPNSGATQTHAFDVYGWQTQFTDADGYRHDSTYDLATGAMKSHARDATGLNLVTDYVVDNLGRVTKRTDPGSGSNRNVTYYVYRDSLYQVRVYPGWDTTSNRPTGPTIVTREHRGAASSSDPLYFETLTMTATPNLTSGAPNGTEALANVQGLTRTLTNAAGQTQYVDRYFNLTGLTPDSNGVLPLGTVNTHKYRVEYIYDDRGRLKDVITPTGTTTRTEYDLLNRPTAMYVGTSAGLTQTRAFVYDGTYTTPGTGGVGDGNLTQVTEMPGGGTANRVTQHFYDWRDRRVITISGGQGSGTDYTNRQMVHYTLDNLGRVTTRQQYHADGYSVTDSPADGVPDTPPDSRRRVKTTYSYDDQDRVYRTEVFKINQSTGAQETGTLKTDVWYNKRGATIKTAVPGGLVAKTSYDGAGRTTKTYQTDGRGDASWTDAGSVSDDNVLSQTENQYDAKGDLTFILRKERFHDAALHPATYGELGNPGSTGTTPKARVSYVGQWFDLANRLTDSVNYGTNGGTVLTARPSSLPASGDPHLLTSYGYKADEVQVVALTGNPTAGTFKLTFNGQETAAINWNATVNDVKTALQNLSGIGSNNVEVAGRSGGATAGGPWIVRFVKAKGAADQPEMTATSIMLTGGSATVSTGSQGGGAGRVQTMTDPRGYKTLTDYDLLGRTTRTVEGYSNFVPSNADDRTTEYTYDGNGNVTALKAWMSDLAYQETKWIYGVTTSNPDPSDLNSNDLVKEIWHPSKTTGIASSSEKETLAYNALGQRRLWRDRNGTAHTYYFDVLGRMLADAITTPGTGIDTSVLRLDTSYDEGGRPYLFTSYTTASATSVVNQVLRSFNGFGQLSTEYQAHGGAVDGNSLYVYYAYSEAGSGANHSRLTGITYPTTSRTLTYNYTATLDAALSRLTSQQVSGESQALESYTYLGLGTVVERNRPEPNVKLTYIAQGGDPSCPECDGGDQYRGLDRFGRVVDQRWRKSDATHTDWFGYGYDKNSNRMYRENRLRADHSELYHTGGSSGGYDALNQLTGFKRGTLNTAKDDVTESTPPRSQSWAFDALGNWTTLTTNGTGQDRTHNFQNQVLTVGGGTNPAYDLSGNLTTDEGNRTLKYDAWNRLVKVTNSGTDSTFGYDGLGRRTCETTGGTVGTTLCGHTGTNTRRDLYYSAGWQVLEERVSGQTNPYLYTWSPVYVDALLSRDEGGTRYYAQHDANWNVTALVSTTGTVLERFKYDAYGLPTFMDLNYNGRDASSYGWVYLHQGGRYFRFVTTPTNESGLYHFRRRELSPTLGRWLQLDPIGFNAGDANLHRYVGNTPTNAADPLGLTRWYRPVLIDGGPFLASTPPPGSILEHYYYYYNHEARATPSHHLLALRSDVIGRLLWGGLWMRSGHARAYLDIEIRCNSEGEPYPAASGRPTHIDGIVSATVQWTSEYNDTRTVLTITAASSGSFRASGGPSVDLGNKPLAIQITWPDASLGDTYQMGPWKWRCEPVVGGLLFSTSVLH